MLLRQVGCQRIGRAVAFFFRHAISFLAEGLGAQGNQPFRAFVLALPGSDLPAAWPSDGLETRSTLPAGTTFPVRWFHARNCAVVTPKRSATLTSDSPWRTL